MKKLLKFLFFVGFAAGVVYVIKQVLGGAQSEGAGSGVLPGDAGHSPRRRAIGR